MTDGDSGTRAAGASGVSLLARVALASLLALAAPAVSLLPALAGIHRSAAVVKFPHGYAVTLIVAILVTAAASALGARIAGPAGFAPIRFALAWWGVVSVAVTIAGASLGHARLTELGIAILAAALAGAAAGLPLAARR